MSKFPAIEADQTLSRGGGRQSRPQNVAGDFFVDNMCIDCDSCRWMAPEVFTRVDGKSVVSKQPSSKQEQLKSLQALISCPSGSIHTEVLAPDVQEVEKTFPIRVDEQKLPGVYHCGYHTQESYGSASYLIVHPEGNIIVDCPRYNEKLAQNIEMLGGVRYLFLCHIHSVSGHEKWSKRFSCDRILHSEDVDDSTADVERKLEGSGPWSLSSDIMLVHTPGHTEGSVCLFHRPLKIMFTGDHLTLSKSELIIYEDCSVSVEKHLKSVEKLLDLDFQWMIPGHGGRIEFKDSQEKNSILEELFKSVKRKLSDH